MARGCRHAAWEKVLTSTDEQRAVAPAVVLILLWAAGFSLRVTVLALPPVLDQVTPALGLTTSDIGVVTAVPSVCFAIAAIPGALLIGRLGLLRCLLAGLVVTAIGSAARAMSTDMPLLSATTAAMCLGIALTQAALPALTRKWLPGRIGLATATYTFGLLAGEIAPVALTIEGRWPPAAAGWPSQLFGWSLPVALAALAISIWRPAAVTAAGVDVRSTERLAIWPEWSNPVLWQAGALLGSVNAIYFGLNGFIPGWLVHAGAPEGVRSTLLALNLAQLPAAFLMVRFTERLVRSAWVYVAASAGLVGSGIALGIAPTVMPIVTASLAGFLLASLLALALTVAPLVAEQRSVPALTAGIFTIGYGMAVFVTLAIGWLSRLGARWIEIAPIVTAGFAVAAVGPLIARRLTRSER